MKILFCLCLLSTFILGTAVAAEDFDLDQVHTNVGFSIRHMLVSNTKGNFKNFSGTLAYDPSDLANSKFTAKIQVNSIDTDNEKRDEHLKSSDFFDVEKFPEITFESTKFEKSNKNITVIGILTMHGVKKEVILPLVMTEKVKDAWGNTRIGMHSEFVVNRQDYGITWSQVLDNGGLTIGNDVKVELDAEWTLKKAAA